MLQAIFGKKYVNRYGVLLGTLVTLCIFCIALISFNLYWGALNNDLSRNEHIYSEIARVISEGGLPYRDTWDHKPPMVYFLMALSVRLFGTYAASIHLVGVVIGLSFAVIAGLFAFELTRSRVAAIAAFLAGMFYGGLGASTETDPDWLMVMLGMTSFWLVYIGRNSRKRMLLAGLVFAGAFFSKQPVLTQLPALFVFSYLVSAPDRRWRNIVSLFAGIVSGVALMLAWVLINGIGEAFWYQAFDTNFLYSLGRDQKWHFQEEFIEQFRNTFLPETLPYLLPLVIFGIASAALSVKNKHPLVWWAFFWFVSSAAGAVIGRSLTTTHFSQTLPALIILNALAIPYYAKLKRAWQAGALVSLLLLVVILHNDNLKLPALHKLNNEQDKLAPILDVVIENTNKDQCLWTWGEFEGHINYYANRPSCTRHLQSMPLMVSEAFDITRNRSEYMEDLIANTPALHVRSEVWGYFPELRKYADRYLGPALISEQGLTVFGVDRSMWHPLYANYANHIELMGVDLYSAQLVPGQDFPVSLTWRVLSPVTRQYGLFIHLVSSDQQTLLARYDGLPASDRPTETWLNTSEIILSDVVVLDIPDDIPPGDYYLVSGFYDFETGAELEVFDEGKHSQGHYATLASLTITE